MFPTACIAAATARHSGGGSSPPSVASLEFHVQPAGAAVDTPFTTQPVIRALDGVGAVVTAFTGDITMSVATGTGTLSGTLVVAAVAGVATFTDLQLDTAGDFTLHATDGTNSVNSNSLTVSAGFSPSDLSPIVWLDASQLTGLSDSDPVASFTDESGNSNSPAQATAGQKPLFKTDGPNGKPYILWDGVDDYMTKAFTLAQSTTLYMVAKYVSFGAGASMIDGGNPNSARIYDGNGVGGLGIYAGNNCGIFSVDNNWHAFKVVYNGASSGSILDGGPNVPPRVGDSGKITTGDAGTNAAGGLTLGCYAGLSAFGNVAIAELVEVDGLTSGTDDTNVFEYFATKYGTTIPSITGPNKTDLTTNDGTNGYYSLANPFQPSDAGKVLRQTSGTGWNQPCGILIDSILGPNASYNDSQYAAVLSDPSFLGHSGTEETDLGTAHIFTPTKYLKFVGNSITDGSTGLTGATGFDKYLASYMDQSFEGSALFDKTEWFMQSFGFGGGQTSAIMASTPGQALPPFAGATKNILVFMEWVNQMSFGDPGTTSPTAQYAFAQTYATARRLDGWLVIYISPTAYNGEDLVTVTQAMRDQLAAGFANGDFDGFVDLGAIPESQDHGDLTYFGDGIHPTNALHAIIGEAVRTEILRVAAL